MIDKKIKKMFDEMKLEACLVVYFTKKGEQGLMSKNLCSHDVSVIISELKNMVKELAKEEKLSAKKK